MNRTTQAGARPAVAAAVPLVFLAVLAAFAAVVLSRDPLLRNACLQAAVAGGIAVGIWYLAARGSGDAFPLSIEIHRHHWVQTLAQVTIYAWWGWYAPNVYAFVPLIVAQLLFAYAVEALVSLSRRGRYALGFGPFPVVLSINLFLWFRPDFFHWQFALIVVGYLGKELIRWNRDGRSAHIFNPSSFPLAITGLVLLATGASDITLGSFIANSQHDPPLIYLVIFLAALPGQILFGVARMTLASVVTMYVFSALYFQLTGTYFFYDAHIPVPVFLGMHLLFTDPSTSPRSELGRIGFGVLYALGILGFYALLTNAGAPTFYDKLLPVPLMNLTVRTIDRWAGARPWTKLDPARLAPSLRGVARNAAWTGAWVLAFTTMMALRGLSDRHPGQYLPFWLEACGQGSTRACDYSWFLTVTYCNNGSGWACNEMGVGLARSGRSASEAFTRACSLGYGPGCENETPGATERREWARGNPAWADLPVVLRGTKPALTGLSQEELRSRACEQGWPGACAAGWPNAG